MKNFNDASGERIPKNKLKILIATPLYPPEIGGPATYVRFLEENLPKEDFELTVIKFGEVLHFPYIVRHLVFFWKVFVRAGKADIVYALDPLGVGLPSGIATRLRGKKFLLRIAGDRAWETAVQKWNVTESLDSFSSSSSYGLRVWVLKFGQKCTARLAWKIVVPGNYLKKIVFNWGIRKNKIYPVYNAFSPLSLSETKEELRKSLSLSGSVIFSAGRLVQWKGFEMLIRAIPEIAEDFPDIKLYIAGDGPEKEKLLNFVRLYHAEEKVIFLGVLPKETLHRYVKAADVFVLNTFYEGFSHQLLEAMSLGTPVATTTSGGNPELIESGKDGLLVTYNDTRAFASVTSILLKEKEYAAKLAKSAKEKAKTFSVERAVSEFVQVIKNKEKS